jgi:tetratricopeptide (TPR) repeat protein
MENNAWVWMRFNDPELLKKETNKNETFYTEYINRGILYFASKYYSCAIREFTAAINTRLDNDEPAYMLRGNVKLESLDYEGATEDYYTALTINPGNKKAEEMLAIAKYKRDYYKDKYAIAGRPHSLIQHYYDGMALFAMINSEPIGQEILTMENMLCYLDRIDIDTWKAISAGNKYVLSVAANPNTAMAAMLQIVLENMSLEKRITVKSLITDKNCSN